MNRVQGQITAKDRNDIILLPHTKIELEKLGNTDLLIAKVETDDKGFFEINNIEKGKYRLVVHFIFEGRELIPKYAIILKVKKSDIIKSNRYIFVTLTADCGENIVKLIEKKE